MNKTHRQSGHVQHFSDSAGFAHIVAVLIIAAVLIGGGYYLYTKQKGSVAVSPSPSASVKASTSPSPSVSASSTPNPTVGLKTYVNAKYGFEFKYPSNWIFDDQSANSLGGLYLILSPPDAKPMTGYFDVQIDTRTDLAVIRQLYIDGGYQEKIVTVGGKTAYQYIRDNSSIYYIQLSQKILVVNTYEKRADTTQILSTFRFTK